MKLDILVASILIGAIVLGMVLLMFCGFKLQSEDKANGIHSASKVLLEAY